MSITIQDIESAVMDYEQSQTKGYVDVIIGGGSSEPATTPSTKSDTEKNQRLIWLMAGLLAAIIIVIFAVSMSRKAA